MKPVVKIRGLSPLISSLALQRIEHEISRVFNEMTRAPVSGAVLYLAQMMNWNPGTDILVEVLFTEGETLTFDGRCAAQSCKYCKTSTLTAWCTWRAGRNTPALAKSRPPGRLDSLVTLQMTGFAMGPDFLQRFRFYLADALAGDAEFPAHLFERMVDAVHEAVPHLEDLAFLRRKVA